MSTWVGIEIDELEIESFQNYYHSWFFKKSDRVREVYPRDEEGNISEDEFIGYRATAASIRRRMVLDGYDIDACKAHFLEYRHEIVESLERYFSDTGDGHSVADSKKSPNGQCWEYYLAAVRNSQLEDWISLLPEALRLQKKQRKAGYNHFTDAPLYIVSPEPLVNVMLSHFDYYTRYVLTGPLNFPCNNSDHFVTALLASCPDDALFELNIEPLIRSGYSDDFTDLEEIHQKETQPHTFSRESIQEIQRISATQPENLSLQRMCYASIITAMEAYLGDILRREIFSRPAVKERFVSSYPAFNDRKFKLSEIFTRLEKIDAEITRVLDELSLHKIDTAKNIFSSTLLTEFPAEFIPFLGAAVKYRHDIVHRNGRDTAGNLLSIDQEAVEELANKVLAFTRAVDAQVLDDLLDEHEADKD